MRCDVAVVGAGAAGVAAAVAAGGLRVIVIEREGFVGGLASSAMVGTLCGLYYRSLGGARYAVRGFARMFAEQLEAASGTKPVRGMEGLYFLPYQVDAFHREASRKLRQHGVLLRLHSLVTGVEYEGRRIVRLTVHSPDEDWQVETGAVIDCTGEARLSRLAGLPCQPGALQQANAFVFRVAGLPDLPESALVLTLIRALRRGIEGQALGRECEGLSIVPGSVVRGSALLKLGMPRQADLTQAELTARARSHEIVNYLRGRDAALAAMRIVAFVRYTSGTTGQSKGVVLSHKRILERVGVTCQALGLTPEDAVLWVLPMAYHFLVTILVYLRSGAAIVLAQDLLAHHLVEAANRHRVTLMYAAPMPIRLLTAAAPGALSTLKYVISTSSAIPPAVARSFTERHGVPVVQAYGAIEAGLPLIDHLSTRAAPETVGYPIAGFEVALLDEGFSPVADGRVGRLAVRGPGMFDAYLKPWQPAASVLPDGWFLTGDLARRAVDGRIVVCGREKHLINVAGNKVFPEEVEAVLNAHPDVAVARVFGKAHSLMGEIVCAEVVAAGDMALEMEALQDFCRSRLSTYKVPQHISQVAGISHTHSGKVQRGLQDPSPLGAREDERGQEDSEQDLFPGGLGGRA